MRYLLDTNILSELRKRSGNAGVKGWAGEQHTDDLAISVVTIIEIKTGILLKSRQDPEQARMLTSWFEDHVLTGFADRILPLDLPAAQQVAPLHVPDKSPTHDALIAGIALSRSLVVVTRNTRDFAFAGVEFLNPWSEH